MKLVRQFIISFLAFLSISFIVGCGGGGSDESQVNTKGTTDSSTRLIENWLANANQDKINSYNSDRSSLVFQYATSVGARVFGNSAIIAGSRQSFAGRTSAVINGFKTVTTDTALSFEMDKSAISEILTNYESSDITFIGNSLSSIGADTALVAATQNDIRILYNNVRQFVQSL
jgi:hypothetical protein